MMMMRPLAELTDLELWTFCCIVSVFVSLVSYGIILVKDQMIIQVEILSLHPYSFSNTSLVKSKLKGNQFMSYFSISLDNFDSQGVIMNDEGDAVEFSPRNSRKVWSSEKKEVADYLVMMLMLTAMIMKGMMIKLVGVPAKKDLLIVPLMHTTLGWGALLELCFLCVSGEGGEKDFNHGED